MTIARSSENTVRTEHSDRATPQSPKDATYLAQDVSPEKAFQKEESPAFSRTAPHPDYVQSMVSEK